MPSISFCYKPLTVNAASFSPDSLALFLHYRAAMKTLPTFLMFTAISLVFAVSSASANTFAYSYSFEKGLIVSGTFDGTANGNLINDISNVSVVFNGEALNGTISIQSMVTPGQWVFQDGGAYISFDGTQNNFQFNFYGNYTSGDAGYYGYVASFWGGQEPGTQPVISAFLVDKTTITFSGATDGPLNKSWLITDLSTPSVPDSGMTGGMLLFSIFGLIGFTGLKRKFTKVT